MITDDSRNEITTISLKSEDDSLYRNAENANGAGLEVRVSRTYDGVGLSGGRECEWCKERECDNVTLDEAYRIGAFQRHPGCGCEIEYTNTKGKTTIQTGKFSGWSMKEELAKRKEVGLEPELYADELSSRIDRYLGMEKTVFLREIKSGGFYSRAVERASEAPKPALEKSIRSHIKEIELHEWKIQNPGRYMQKADSSNPREVEYAVIAWKKDRRRNARQALIELETWRRKYGKE